MYDDISSVKDTSNINLIKGYGTWTAKGDSIIGIYKYIEDNTNTFLDLKYNEDKTTLSGAWNWEHSEYKVGGANYIEVSKKFNCIR